MYSGAAVIKDDEDENEEDRALFEAAAKKGLYLRKLIETKKKMMEAAKEKGDSARVALLTQELVCRCKDHRYSRKQLSVTVIFNSY